jgi:hypothetical protein
LLLLSMGLIEMGLMANASTPCEKKAPVEAK